MLFLIELVEYYNFFFLNKHLLRINVNNIYFLKFA